jgi:hypothetical protein
LDRVQNGSRTFFRHFSQLEDSLLDRIDCDGPYSKENNQWLSAKDHHLKSAKEKARLSDKQALEILLSGKSSRKAGKENSVSRMTAWKIQNRLSYKWLDAAVLVANEEKENDSELGGVRFNRRYQSN